VLARCTGTLRAGETVRVRLTEADPALGRIEFTAAH
jgi:RNase II-type exonuclease C-terminal S1 domain